MRAHFEMCYMVTKFPKRMLRVTWRPIRIERLIQKNSYVENIIKRRKYSVRNSAYVIQLCEQYK
jgi:hypothetical protein